MKEHKFIEWLAPGLLIGVAALVIGLFIYLVPVVKGCIGSATDFVEESIERVSPAECKKRCESAGASTWTVNDGDCACSGKVEGN